LRSLCFAGCRNPIQGPAWRFAGAHFFHAGFCQRGASLLGWTATRQGPKRWSFGLLFDGRFCCCQMFMFEPFCWRGFGMGVLGGCNTELVARHCAITDTASMDGVLGGAGFQWFSSLDFDAFSAELLRIPADFHAPSPQPMAATGHWISWWRSVCCSQFLAMDVWPQQNQRSFTTI